MKLEDTLTLLRAGYTKAEIDAMETGNKAQHAEDLNLSASADNTSLAASKQVSGKAKEQDTGEADKKADASPADPAPKSAGTDDSRVMDAIDRLTLAIQKMNITNSNIQGGDQEQAPEDIIAQIINPPLPKRGGK